MRPLGSGVSVNSVAEALRGVLSKHAGVRLAMLFGSVSRGEGGPLSDIDVAVVGDVDEASLIGDIARGLGVPVEGVDVVNALKVSVKVLRNILKHGVCICGDEDLLKGLYAGVLSQYPDVSITQALNMKYSLSMDDSVDEKVLIELANNIATRVRSIKELLSMHGVGDLRSNMFLDSALRWLVYETVQTMIDACTHVVASLKLGVGETYKDSVIIMMDKGLMKKQLGEIIIEYDSLRNRLTHRYRYVQADELYQRAEELMEKTAPRFRGWIYEIIEKYRAKSS